MFSWTSYDAHGNMSAREEKHETRKRKAVADMREKDATYKEMQKTVQPDKVQFQAMTIANNYTLPSRHTPGSAGYDFYARETTFLEPGTVTRVNTDIRVALGDKVWGKLHAPSSLVKIGVLAVGGVIDSDYEGHVYGLMYNTTAHRQIIRIHDKCFQMVLMPLIVSDEDSMRGGTRTDSRYTYA